MDKDKLPWPLMINCPEPRRERWAVMLTGAGLLPLLALVAPVWLLLEMIEQLYAALRSHAQPK